MGLVLGTMSLAQQGQPTPLVEAAGKADIARVLSLLDGGANPNEADNSDVKGWTPLMAAAKAGSADVVEALLKAHANVNATNEYGGTALSVAIANQGKSARVAELLRAAAAEEPTQTASQQSATAPSRTKKPHSVIIRGVITNLGYSCAMGRLSYCDIEADVNLVEARRMILGDTYLQLVALGQRQGVVTDDPQLRGFPALRVRTGHSVFDIIFDGSGRSAIGSNLPRASYATHGGWVYGGPIPTAEPTVAFSFDCKDLNEGKYLIAVQRANIPKNAEHFVTLEQTRLWHYAHRRVVVEVTKSTGPTIDIGEVILINERARGGLLGL